VSEVSVQSALQMSAPSLLVFARNKRLSRSELGIVIEDLAAARRAPGRTRKQGYNDFVTQDALGIELHRLFAAAGADPSVKRRETECRARST